MIVMECDYWRPEALGRHESAADQAEREHRKAFGRHHAASFEIRECAEEASAAGLVGDVMSWPLGCMPHNVRREFYSVYARRRNGEAMSAGRIQSAIHSKPHKNRQRIVQ